MSGVISDSWLYEFYACFNNFTKLSATLSNDIDGGME